MARELGGGHYSFMEAANYLSFMTSPSNGQIWNEYLKCQLRIGIKKYFGFSSMLDEVKIRPQNSLQGLLFKVILLI